MKQRIKISIVMVMRYFHLEFEHGLPPSLNLNHNAYSIFPRIHVRLQSMAGGTKVHFNFPELSEWTLLETDLRDSNCISIDQ